MKPIIGFWLASLVALTACSEDNSLYRAPFDWEVLPPEAAGMNTERLEAAFDDAFADGTYTQAALVIKDGKLVYERYRGASDSERALLHQSLFSNSQDFEVRTKDSLATSWSVAKSFVSILVGIAIDQGRIDSINEPASRYISEWRNTDKSEITIKNLLDMRSGLVPICATAEEGAIRLTDCNRYESSGGELVFAEDQRDLCINRRTLARTGIKQPWAPDDLIWKKGYFLYSNCDTQVLGEILFAATGIPLQEYAERYLFSKIGMKAYWWRDNASGGHQTGHYLAYCCLDTTPRDFARFGQLILNMGKWGSERIVSASYIQQIRDIVTTSRVRGGSYSYGLKFWTVEPSQHEDGNLFPLPNTVLAALGFDEQIIMIDFENNLVVVRNSLHQPLLQKSLVRKMLVNSEDVNHTYAPLTLPDAASRLLPDNTASSTFSGAGFLYGVSKSLNAYRQSAR